MTKTTQQDNKTEPVEELRKLYTVEDAMQVIVDHVAARGRLGDKMTVEEVQLVGRNHNKALDRRDVLAVLRRLGKLGLGRFRESRRGAPARIEWNTRAAEELLDRIDEISGAQEPGQGAGVTMYINDGAKPATFRHSYLLRPAEGLVVYFELPLDLTIEEADRLSRNILSLPTQTKPDKPG